jgi:hypothetical protein
VRTDAGDVAVGAGDVEHLVMTGRAPHS